jgi:hypothetical protein
MSRVSRAFKFIKGLVKFAFTLFIASVCGLLIWRIVSSSPPESMERLEINDAIYEAYNRESKELYVFRQEQNSTTRAENNAGYFSVTNAVFVPDANQIQVTLRYNNSTIKHLVEDYSLSETPSRDSDLFDMSLFFSVDLTPENTEDNAIISEEATRTFRCPAKLVASEKKNLYNYRKFVFDLDECGEDLSALLDSRLLLAVYADVFYVEDMDLDKKAYGTLCLYDYVSETEDVKLSSDEIKAIESWKKVD